MPKRIPLKDSKTLYYALRLGENDGEVKYGNLYNAKCQLIQSSNSSVTNAYGKDLEYDAIALIQTSKKTTSPKFIDRFSKIWIFNKPQNSEEFAEFNVVEEPIEHDGILIIYLMKEVENLRNIWYELNGKIYTLEVKFSYDKKSFTIPSNMYLPITNKNKIWLEEPTETSEPIFIKNRSFKKDYTVFNLKVF